MIIQHNIMSLNAHNRMGANGTAVSKNLEKLSSGYKINRAGDDAAGLAISEKMRGQITGLNRAQQNAQDGISLVQTAEGNLTEVHSMLNRMVDLATQASNGIYESTDLANLTAEMDALNAEIDRIGTNADFNGTKLFDGNFTKDLQIGDTSAQTLEVKITKLSAADLLIDNGSITIDTATNANTAITAIKTAINTVSTQRSGLGAIQNRLEHTVSNLATTAENMTAAESRIRDTDMAKEMMAFTKNNVLSQAAQAMLAQANQQPQQVLQLLR